MVTASKPYKTRRDTDANGVKLYTIAVRNASKHIGAFISHTAYLAIENQEDFRKSDESDFNTVLSVKTGDLDTCSLCCSLVSSWMAEGWIPEGHKAAQSRPRLDTPARKVLTVESLCRTALFLFQKSVAEQMRVLSDQFLKPRPMQCWMYF